MKHLPCSVQACGNEAAGAERAELQLVEANAQAKTNDRWHTNSNKKQRLLFMIPILVIYDDRQSTYDEGIEIGFTPEAFSP